MIVFTISCHGKIAKERITVTGTALNAKRSAIIVTDSNQVYYIDKLFSWDPKLYGKRVKVNGELVIETNEGSKEDVEVQEIIGSIRVVQNAKWEVLK